MIRTLELEDIKLGIWVLRNDLVSSSWLEDRINSEEKLQSFLKCWKETKDKELFKIIC